jgi:hypothetical protein
MNTDEEIKEVSDEQLNVLLDLGSDMMMPNEENTPTSIFAPPTDIADPLSIDNINNIANTDELSEAEKEAAAAKIIADAKEKEDEEKKDTLSPDAIDDLLTPKGDDENEPGAATQLSGTADFFAELIKDEKIVGFEDDKPLSEYTAKDFEDLIKANVDSEVQKKTSELPKEMFDNMPVELQQAYKYFSDGGQDVQGLMQHLGRSLEVKAADTSTEQGQKEVVRQYLRATDYGTAEEIEEEITDLEDRDSLLKKANQFKPKLDSMQDKITSDKLSKQENALKQRQDQSEKYAKSVFTVLDTGKIGDVEVDNETQNMIYSGLVQSNYPSINGKNTNLLGHLLEKYQWVEPDHELLSEALWLLADSKGYKEKLRSSVESKVTADTVRKLKTSQGANNATTNTEKPAKETRRGVAQKVIPKKRNFFAR